MDVEMIPARQLAYEFITSRIPNGSRVLDVGAGSAPLAGILAARDCDVTAIDLDYPALEVGLKSSPAKYAIKQVDLSARPWPVEGQFDAITAVYSLQHLLSDEAEAWLEIRRLLKPRGLFLYIGRYLPWTARESSRGDPLNATEIEGIRALGQATGFI